MGESIVDQKPKLLHQELPNAKNPIEIIHEIEKPFYQVMRRLHGDRWRVCMMASYTLSKTISRISGIPIGQNLDGEHIELDVGIYDPTNAPDHEERMEEQTYIKYYDGKGNIYFIDAIYGLLMEDKNSEESNIIKIDKFSSDEFDTSIKEKYHIHKFDANYPNIRKINAFNEEKGYIRTGNYLKILRFLNLGNEAVGEKYQQFGLLMPPPYQYESWVEIMVGLYNKGLLSDHNLLDESEIGLFELACPEKYQELYHHKE